MPDKLEMIGSVSAATGCLSRTHADLIVGYLKQIGVDYVFGVPGGAIEPFYDALALEARRPPADIAIRPSPKLLSRKTLRAPSKLQVVVARHESGAAFMADGYARETGNLGVCCATTGPGTTNLITGVASAYADCIPMLVVTAQTALPGFGSQALQESSGDAVDTVGMFAHCTRYNTLVSHPDQLERKLLAALVCAFQRPRGPAHLSIPMDVLRAPVSSHALPVDIATLFRQPDIVDADSFDALCAALIHARKIVLFIGNDCREISDKIAGLSDLLNADIVTTPSGKSWVEAFHPAYRGVFGFAGHASARKALLDEQVDLVLAVGTSFDELSTCGWDKKALMNDKLVHIDAAMENFVRSPMARLHIYGNVRTIFTELLQVLGAHREHLQSNIGLSNVHHLHKTFLEVVSNKEPLKQSKVNAYVPGSVVLDSVDKFLSNSEPIKPQHLMLELAKRFPQNTRFLSDAGNSWAWTTHYLFLRSTGNYRIGMGYGAMAWAIGAAVGTAMGSKGAPVVCITGDGSFLMSGQEITVAVQHKLPVIYVILNDQALGMVKHGQRLGGGEPIGYELPRVDFAAIARAMGALAYTIRTLDDIAVLDIYEICNASKPTLLDVYIDPEEVPPMKARMKVLESNAGLDE